ncbi:hypothetical protein DTO271D3_6995 [Paecilomyces variotii]|nr:hypothetical protein DTO271D3_6995 [Paecilomyces variotii]
MSAISSLSTSRYPTVYPSPTSATSSSAITSLVPTSAIETIPATFQTSLLTTTVKFSATLSGEATTVTARTTKTATVLQYSTSSVEGTTTITLPYSTLSHIESTTTVVTSEAPKPVISPSSVSIVPSSRIIQSERTTPVSTSAALAVPTTSSAGRLTATAKTTVSVVTPTPSTIFVPSSNTLSICPSRIINPTYTAPTPLPTDYTWGCPPGYLCHPKKSVADGNCNFEAGPPADTYYCSPEECIPVPPLHAPQYPVSNKTEKYIVSPGYFNLNPTEFGLDYGVFAFPNGSSLENGQEERRRGQKKRQYSSSIIPGLCFDQCNNCMVEAQQTGKTPLLCQNGSEFKIQLDMCDSCVESHWDAIITIGGILPQFQQFLDFCGNVPSQPTPQSGNSPPAATESEAATSLSKDTTLSTETGKTESTLTPSMTTSPAPATTETSVEPTTAQDTTITICLFIHNVNIIDRVHIYITLGRNRGNFNSDFNNNFHLSIFSSVLFIF